MISRPDEPRMPVELNKANRLAWDIHGEIVAFGGLDGAGMPTLEKAELVLSTRLPDITSKDRFMLLYKLRLIHGLLIEVLQRERERNRTKK